MGDYGSRCPSTWPSEKVHLVATYPRRKCVPTLLHFTCFIFNGSLRKFGFLDRCFVHTEIVALDDCSMDCLIEYCV